MGAGFPNTRDPLDTQAWGHPPQELGKTDCLFFPVWVTSFFFLSFYPPSPLQMFACGLHCRLHCFMCPRGTEGAGAGVEAGGADISPTAQASLEGWAA